MRVAYSVLILAVVLSIWKIDVETDKFMAYERAKQAQPLALVVSPAPQESWIEITADGGEDHITIYSAECPDNTGDEELWWVVRTDHYTASGHARYVPDRVLSLWSGVSLLAEKIREGYID